MVACDAWENPLVRGSVLGFRFGVWGLGLRVKGLHRDGRVGRGRVGPAVRAGSASARLAATARVHVGHEEISGPIHGVETRRGEVGAVGRVHGERLHMTVRFKEKGVERRGAQGAMEQRGTWSGGKGGGVKGVEGGERGRKKFYGGRPGVRRSVWSMCAVPTHTGNDRTRMHLGVFA